ncbi:MAG: carboxypeptidase-like regulatory domain-containing protein [Candidatus Bathyarchaeota archaeon]|nr:carboxypeptidase-like regulatory domain-containing protein [Candidatus Bathyarchaeota archaeon]
MTAITEGYVFSKHSDYGTDDRDYVQGDILYVWAWSSRVDPYNVREHYCQIRLDEYVYEFYLNYDQNMTQPNSFTGSFNLSRLEKTGEWTVQISLRTSPPKPISFDETDVIQVSPKAPPTHELSISSSPISGVIFTLNGTNRTTPFSSSLEEGIYMVVMPLNLTVAGKVYSFVEWDNGIASPIRSIDLTEYTAIMAYYATPIEPSTSTITGKITDNQGTPITNAKVTIVETEEVTFTLSEPAGEYTFEDLTPSTYTIRVEASGYITAQTSVVAEPDEIYTQNFSLTPKTTETVTSTITGKITDNEGNPIIDAKVTIVETEEVTYTLSEPAGQYTFENLTQGNYTIRVEASGYITAQASVVVEAAVTYIQNFSLTPETTEPLQRIPIELWQLGAVSLAVIGATALLLLWRSRKSFLKEIKKTEYKNTLETVRLEANLKKLDNLLQKGFLSKERYETVRREIEDELARIRSLKS